MLHTTPISSSLSEPNAGNFVDRRESPVVQAGSERRQFASSHRGLSSEARELALAIDGYKLAHRRRYITFEEMLQVIQELGYHK